MNKFLSLFIIFILINISSLSEAKSFCSKTKNYYQNNSLKKLKEIEIEVFNKKKWYRNIFSIVRDQGWIDNDIKKNHRAKVTFKFDNGFICQNLARIRFHGDNPDHYKIVDDFHIISSLNVKLSNTNIENITEFKLFLPHTRGDENEIFATNFLRELNYFSPKTKKLYVKFEGIKTEYLFQEKISKEFIEDNGFPEGPIIEGDQRFLHSGLRSLQLGRIVNKNWASRNWRNAYISIEALSKLNKVYLDFYSNIPEFKVSKPYAIYNSNLALNGKNFFYKKNSHLNFYDDLISTMNYYDHALIPDNRSFYFNYFENYFYPIYYDGDINIGKKQFTHSDTDQLKDNGIIIEKIRDINKKNLNYLNKVSGVIKINSKDTISYFDSIISNLKNIKKVKSKNEKDLLTNKHTKFYSNFKIDHIKLIFFKNYPNKFYICLYDLSECKEKTFKLSQIGDILSQTFENNSQYKYIFVTNNFKNYSEKDYFSIKKSNWINIKRNNLNIKYIKNKINLEIDQKNKIINVTQLKKDGRVFIYSNKKLKNWTVNFNSIFKYSMNTIISNNSESLDGCITIYETEIENIKLNINNGVCEDSLNIVRSKGIIDKIYISNSFKDGLDMDFSNVKINEIEVDISGNDCVDMSFGNYNINSLNLNECKDNAVSIGEKSNLNSKNLYVKNSLNALAVKDSSKVNLKSLISKNNNFCFKLYNKKQEFLGGELRLNKLVCDSQYTVDNNSIFINNEL
tara:strand:- start:1978 stop:4188 length:2211 start_codon:yes stop_codon:yes gene_type:complete